MWQDDGRVYRYPGYSPVILVNNAEAHVVKVKIIPWPVNPRQNEKEVTDAYRVEYGAAGETNCNIRVQPSLFPSTTTPA